MFRCPRKRVKLKYFLVVDHTLLYVTAAPSVAGRHHFRGRRMFDGLMQHAATVMVAHFRRIKGQ